jgi:UDP-N-acetylmuramate dehydrogenase
MGKPFMGIDILDGNRVRAGTAALDMAVARSAMEAEIAGLEFFRGIPGSIGGALRMNGGAYEKETKDVLIEAEGVTRAGAQVTYSIADMGYSYRHSSAPADVYFTSAVFQGTSDKRDEIEQRMNEITERRETSQPIRTRTGGSTFKNPKGHKSWQLIDAAGCRGLMHGGAQVSEKHCNFLINTGEATASDIEALGEEVRARVKETSGVTLDWEIRRIGVASSEALS